MGADVRQGWTVDVEELIQRVPTVFHMAPATSWPSLQLHGLLSTEQLVNLYGVDDARRASILLRKRETVVTLRHPSMPEIVIRDQKPMKFIDAKIDAGSSLEMYLQAINARVFFWASRERLLRLLGAREYRDQPQVVLHVDTARLLAAHGSRVELCRFNSGAVTQANHPRRGHRSWLPVHDYPYTEYRHQYGAAHALTEVTVVGGVPDVLDLTVQVEFPAVPGGAPPGDRRAE